MIHSWERACNCIRAESRETGTIVGEFCDRRYLPGNFSFHSTVKYRPQGRRSYTILAIQPCRLCNSHYTLLPLAHNSVLNRFNYSALDPAKNSIARVPASALRTISFFWRSRRASREKRSCRKSGRGSNVDHRREEEATHGFIEEKVKALETIQRGDAKVAVLGEHCA